MKSNILILVLLICIAGSQSRVPPRNQETEETDKSKEIPIVNPSTEDKPEINPVSNTENVENDDKIERTYRKRLPFGVILVRQQQPRLALNPFILGRPASHFGAHDHSLGGDFHNDPAFRLFSILLNRPSLRSPLDNESSVESTDSESNESTETETKTKLMNPFETLFPNIFVPRFPIDESENETLSSSNDKTPDNYENKEKKVITIGDKKFVKTTQIKKVKNDFGQFSSVIHSLQPFDEKIHDENGNEKIKPEDTESSSIDKKEVPKEQPKEIEQPKETEQPKEIEQPKESVPVEKIEKVSSTTESKIEKEEATSPSTITNSVKPNEKLISSNLNKETDDAKNEINDTAKEIKVDQMNK